MSDRRIAFSAELLGSNLLQRLEGRWNLRILLCLNRGEQRFTDLKQAIPPISGNVLTERIRGLERAGLVERSYLPPPFASKVYRLTAAATGLKPTLDALERWRAENVDQE